MIDAPPYPSVSRVQPARKKTSRYFTRIKFIVLTFAEIPTFRVQIN